MRFTRPGARALTSGSLPKHRLKTARNSSTVMARSLAFRELRTDSTGTHVTSLAAGFKQESEIRNPESCEVDLLGCDELDFIVRSENFQDLFVIAPPVRRRSHQIG